MNDDLLKIAPSKSAVVRYLRNEPGAWKDIGKTLAQRTVLIAAGIVVLGNRDNILRNSFAGSVAIELYLLWYYKQQLEMHNE